MVGLYLYYGTSVKEDRVETKKWFTLSADQGDKTAIEALSDYYGETRAEQ